MQLSVPVLAALGGIAFLAEPLTLRLVAAAVLVLGGIALVVFERSRGGAPHAVRAPEPAGRVD